MKAELCLEGTFVKISFTLVTILLDIYENPRRKNFINTSSSKYSKIIINYNRKWHKLLFLHFFVVPQKRVIFGGTKKNC